MGNAGGFLAHWLTREDRPPGEFPKRITDGKREGIALDPEHEAMLRRQWAEEEAARQK